MYWVDGLLLRNYNRQLAKCQPIKKKRTTKFFVYIIKLTMTIEKIRLQ